MQRLMPITFYDVIIRAPQANRVKIYSGPYNITKRTLTLVLGALESV